MTSGEAEHHRTQFFHILTLISTRRTLREMSLVKQTRILTASYHHVNPLHLVIVFICFSSYLLFAPTTPHSFIAEYLTTERAVIEAALSLLLLYGRPIVFKP
jgi:hypothetical protein